MTENQNRHSLKKSPEYMRKAYTYTAILFVIALIGSSILAMRIIAIENLDRPATEATEEEGDEGDQVQGVRE